MENILDGAVRVFGRRGYLGANLNEVAEEAGVSKPTLYAHFKNKAQLYSDVLLHVHRKCMRELEAVVEEQATAREKIQAVLEHQFRYARQNADFVRVVHSMMFLPEDVRPQINPTLIMEERFGFTERIVREGIRSGELCGDSMEIAMVIASLGGVGMAQAIFPSLPILQAGTAKRLWDVVFHGAAGHAEKDPERGSEE
jgi:AcrR family transcriptional regulator